MSLPALLSVPNSLPILTALLAAERHRRYNHLFINLSTYPPKNVHFFTDNIVREVSSEQICPRFLPTYLSSNIVEIFTIQKADPFPSFSTEH